MSATKGEKWQTGMDLMAPVRTARLTKRTYSDGTPIWADHGTPVSVGYRRKYHDFSF